MLGTTIEDTDGHETAAVDLYFLNEAGGTFRSTLVYQPYFYVGVQERFARDASVLLQRRFEGLVASVTLVDKEDLVVVEHERHVLLVLAHPLHAEQRGDGGDQRVVGDRPTAMRTGAIAGPGAYRCRRWGGGDDEAAGEG